MKIKGDELYNFNTSWNEITCWRKVGFTYQMFVINKRTLEDILRKQDYITVKKTSRTHLKLDDGN